MDKPPINYFFHCNGTGANVKVPRDRPTEEYCHNQRRFAKLAAPRNWADMPVGCEHFTDYAEGVPFTWHPSGSAGASFYLFQMPPMLEPQIKMAKAYLQAQRDVVALHTVAISSIIDFKWEKLGK